MKLSGIFSVYVMNLLLIPSFFIYIAKAQAGQTGVYEDTELDQDQSFAPLDENADEESQSESLLPTTKTPHKSKTKQTSKDSSTDLSQKKPLPSKPSDHPEVRLAYAAVKMKKYEEADRLFWKNIENLSLSDMKMMMYSSDKIGKTADAIKAAKLILGRVGNDPDAYTMIGKSHAEKTIQKDSEKIAIENLKKAIEISPKFEPAYLALAAFYEKKIRVLDKRMQNKKKNYYELRLLYQEMAEKFPKKPQYQAQVCKIDALDEQLDHAKDSCRKAMIGNPKDPTGYVYMGIAHQKAKENDEAKRLLSGAVKRFKRSDLANLSWANFLESQGNVVDAYSYFKTVTEINPETADAWSGLARTGMQLSKEDESMQAFRKACSLNPQQAGIDLRKSLGYAKKLRGQLELLEESCR